MFGIPHLRNPFRILNERDLGISELTVDEIVELMQTKAAPELIPRGEFGRTVARLLPPASECKSDSDE